MSRWISLCLLLATSAFAQYPGVGRPATLAEIRAWDIDVRADFAGLPRGSGTVARGQTIWDAKCASCHGTFGESNEVFPPIVGGTTKDDIKTGRVAALRGSDQRTSLMKLAHLSTLWDYIHRAMPWDAPRSLAVDDVYAVTAYVLHLGDILPADFTLSDANMQAVQAMLPNRNGLTRTHGLWEVRGKPDVAGHPCMRNCTAEVRVLSELPAQARPIHGNPVAQHRIVGPVRGADADAPGGSAAALRMAAVATLAPKPALVDPARLAERHGCIACHAESHASSGPSMRAITAKYKAAGDAEQMLIDRVKSGAAGVWGATPMPPQAHVDDRTLRDVIRWMLSRGE